MQSSRRSAVAAGNSNQSGIGWGAGGTAASGGAGSVSYSALTLASTSLVPDFSSVATWRAAADGATYTDPYTARTVRKLAANASMAYANGGPHISRADANGHYLILTSVSGVVTAIRYAPGAGEVNRFTVTGTGASFSGIAHSFSHTAANTLYIFGGGAVHKFTISGTTVTEVVGGVWPKTVTGAGIYPTWLMHDANDRWFVMNGDGDTGGKNVVWAWDSQTDTVRTLAWSTIASTVQKAVGYTIFDINEASIDHTGRYVYAILSNYGAVVWDLVTNAWSGLYPHQSHGSAAHAAMHSTYGWLYNNATSDPLTVLSEGVLAGLFTPIASNGAAPTLPVQVNTVGLYGTNPEYGASGSHTSVAHVQGDVGLNGWWCNSAVWLGDPLQGRVTWVGAWAVHSGAIYKRVYNSGAKTPTGIIQYTSDGVTVTAQLSVVGSIAAVVAGTCYVDTATLTVYAQRSDSGAISATTVDVMTSFPAQHGVFFDQPIGAASRVTRTLCFIPTHPRSSAYGNYPFASTSPDGKVCAFNTDFGVKDGATSVCVVDLPTA